MFAWFEATDVWSEALKKSGVLMVPGSACGDSRKNMWRASLGVEHDVFRRCIDKIKDNLPEIPVWRNEQ
jgi:aspartate/methionine/tyrosine aminotransferase